MAISIESKPKPIETAPGVLTTVMPVYNTIEWVVSSDNINVCNFKYICDIYIENDGIGFIKRLKLFPDQNGFAAFKINSVLKDYIETFSFVNIYSFRIDRNKCIEYRLSFGEEFDTSVDCDQPVVEYPDLLETDLNYAWNAAMQYLEYVRYTGNEFILNPVTPGKFLTHSPERILIGIGEQAELSFLNMPGIGHYGANLVIETFDSSDNIINTVGIPNSSYNVTDYSKLFTVVGVGTHNINTYFTFPVIDAATVYYRVSLLSSNSEQILNNTTMQYLGGANSWTTDSYPGCSTNFGITVANKLQFVMPDVSCGDTLTVQYLDYGFVEGVQYNITINVDNINNPSGSPQYIQARIGGVAGTAFGGVGTWTDTITAGPGGALELIGYFDADTGGFGSHSFSIDLVEVYEVGGARTSEYKYYEIDRRKSRYNPMRLRWLNLLGGYDSYSFNMAKTNKLDISRTEYDKLMPTYYEPGDRGRTLTSVKAVEKVNATSNWLTEKESDWLSELYMSLDVYVQETAKILTFHSIMSFAHGTGTAFLLSCPVTEEDKKLFIGNNVIFDKCDISVNPDINLQSGTEISFYNNSTVYLDYVTSSDTSPDCGIIYVTGRFRRNVFLTQLPIIITSNQFDYKVKARTKNINQSIEFEYAFDKNIQRN